MSVVIGFTIIEMILFLGYMTYRFFLRRKLTTLVFLCLQLFALTISIISFADNLLAPELMQALCILFGIAVPSVFLAGDYAKMTKKAKEQGAIKGIVEPLEKLPYAKGKSRDYIYYYNHGMALYRSGKKEAAIKHFKRAIKLEPENYRSYYNMAVALEETGRLHEAEIAFKKVIDIKPDFVEAYNNLGILFATNKKYNDALVVYNEGLKKNPREYSLCFNIGITLSEMGRYLHAVDAYRSALEIKPQELGVYYHLGAALMQLRRYEDAIEVYKKALKIKPANSEMFYSLATVYSLLRKHDIAIDNLKKAVELDEQLKKEAKLDRAFDAVRMRLEFKQVVS
jgi:tetratricopeptide (TPR) repeat protein